MISHMVVRMRSASSGSGWTHFVQQIQHSLVVIEFAESAALWVATSPQRHRFLILNVVNCFVLH